MAIFYFWVLQGLDITTRLALLAIEGHRAT